MSINLLRAVAAARSVSELKCGPDRLYEVAKKQQLQFDKFGWQSRSNKRKVGISRAHRGDVVVSFGAQEETEKRVWPSVDASCRVLGLGLAA